MSISVVVPSYGRPDSLRSCLEAIVSQSCAPTEVVVVTRKDDVPTRALIADMRAAGRIPVREEIVDVPGQIGALSAGIAAADGDLVAITDDDAAPRPGWLAGMRRLFADPSVVGVGGRDMTWDSFKDSPKSEVGRVRWYGRVIGNHHLGIGKARDVDVLKGANMAFRSHALREHGFDSRLRGNGAQVHNDLRLCLAIRRSGGRLMYDPEVMVDHRPARRPAGDRRDRSTSQQQLDAVHNETLALLEFFPLHRRIGFMIWALLVGRRQSPGVARTVLALVRREGSDPVSRFIATLQGRWAGWRTFRTGR